jgi:hypothetical protein
MKIAADVVYEDGLTRTVAVKITALYTGSVTYITAYGVSYDILDACALTVSEAYALGTSYLMKNAPTAAYIPQIGDDDYADFVAYMNAPNYSFEAVPLPPAWLS